MQIRPPAERIFSVQFTTGALVVVGDRSDSAAILHELSKLLSHPSRVLYGAASVWGASVEGAVAADERGQQATQTRYVCAFIRGERFRVCFDTSIPNREVTVRAIVEDPCPVGPDGGSCVWGPANDQQAAVEMVHPELKRLFGRPLRGAPELSVASSVIATQILEVQRLKRRLLQLAERVRAHSLEQKAETESRRRLLDIVTGRAHSLAEAERKSPAASQPRLVQSARSMPAVHALRRVDAFVSVSMIALMHRPMVIVGGRHTHGELHFARKPSVSRSLSYRSLAASCPIKLVLPVRDPVLARRLGLTGGAPGFDFAREIAQWRTTLILAEERRRRRTRSRGTLETLA